MTELIVTAGPFKCAVWLPIKIAVAPGVAEITLLATVTIGIARVEGFGKEILEETLPARGTPKAPMEATTGLIFELVRVATDPVPAIDLLGRTTPEDPDRALMVFVPTTATTFVVVEVGFVVAFTKISA
jgi:hypothetical protein